MKRMPLTLKGAERLRGELRKLKTVDRPRVIQAIAEARAHGDLSENAEYHAAREQQSTGRTSLSQAGTRTMTVAARWSTRSSAKPRRTSAPA